MAAKKEAPKAETAIVILVGGRLQVVTGLLDDVHAGTFVSGYGATHGVFRRGPNGPAVAKSVGTSEPILIGTVQTLDDALKEHPELADRISISAELERRDREAKELAARLKADAERRAAAEKAARIKEIAARKEQEAFAAQVKKWEAEAEAEVDKELKETK